MVSMRIIGGEASGRRLSSLPGVGTRPTGERVREALFNRWQERIVGALFLDGYAGSGAMGLEALSRGARRAVFCERNAKTLKVLKANIGLLGYEQRAELWPRSIEEGLARFTSKAYKFDLIFLDPPWDDGVSETVRGKIGQLLQVDGFLVIESRQSDILLPLEGLQVVWSKRYGDTRLTGYHA